MRYAWIPFLSLPLVAVVTACSPAAGTTDAGTTDCFVAYAPDFGGYHNWSSAPASAAGDAGDGIHGVGPLTVYWNQSPPHGSDSFPVGTIIVKEPENVDGIQCAAFAMVKRGCDFNSAGADGWEWFSLQDESDGGVSICWSGVAPPQAESYAGQPVGDCNGCHTQPEAIANDSVWDTPLQLSGF